MTLEAPVPRVCFCKNVSRDAWESQKTQWGEVEAATRLGVGCGPCGGVCRPLWQAQFSQQPWAPEVMEAVSLFNRGYYWETHEVLEHLWLEDTTSIRVLYQGLIQASAALYHVLNANPKGVGRLVDEATRKLSPYSPTYQGLQLFTLLQALEIYKSQAEEILSSRRQNFDYDQLPRLVIHPWMT